MRDPKSLEEQQKVTAAARAHYNAIGGATRNMFELSDKKEYDLEITPYGAQLFLASKHNAIPENINFEGVRVTIAPYTSEKPLFSIPIDPR